MALMLVSYGPGGSLGCDLSQNHVLVGRKNLRLLGQMSRLSPHFCVQDRKDFAFPQEMVEGGQLQEGGVPGSRRALCVEEVEALLEHLVEHRDGLILLELVALHHLLGKTKVFSVLQTGMRGGSVHSGQEPEVLPGIQHVSLRQVTTQRSFWAIADQHQGHQ